jgi:TonB family protein
MKHRIHGSTGTKLRTLIPIVGFLLSMWISLPVAKGKDEASQGLNYRPGDVVLNIIAFSGSPVAVIPKGQDLHRTDLPNAEFPIRFSRGLLGDPSASLAFQGLPRQLGFRDIWTVNVGGPAASKSKWLRRRNKLTDLDYRVRLASEKEGPSRLELKGDCRDVWKGSLQFDLPTESSVLIETRASGDQSLFFVLTPLQAVPLDFGFPAPKQPIPIRLKAGSGVMPKYPPEIQDLGLEGTVTLWYFLSADGKPDLTRLIFISCPHPALAKAMATAVRQWRFETSDGETLGEDMPAVATVNFKLRR